MRPPSSPSEPAGLFGGVLARGGVSAEVGDRAWLQAMLDAEAALARAQAAAGLFPAEYADRIAAACRAERFDAARIGADAAASGNPVVPLVTALTEAVGGRDSPAGRHVHHGATSQDILDTAASLVATRALGPLLDDASAAADALAGLAERHRDTPVAGRTLLQQALPTTFGLVAAGWLTGVDDSATRLAEVRAYRLAVQLGGAAGTLASLGDAGPGVVARLATELGLAEPVLPWHTSRTRPAELAAALGVLAGAVAKVARDVTLYAQTEVAEVRERGPAGRGGSSTLPHKRNPVAAVAAYAAAAQAPGLVATVLSVMDHEHQRAAGAWHAEWRPMGELLRSVGSAVAWLRDCAERLDVDADRMRANLDLTGGLLLTERVVTVLSPRLGRLAAHELVEAAAQRATATGRPLAEVLDGVPEMSGVDTKELLDPAGYLGSSGTLVDRALAAYRARPWRNP